MRFIKYMFLSLIVLLPASVFAGTQPAADNLDQQDIEREEELVAYYDLRDRKSYIQVTNVEDENPLCIHVQIFQQDRACSELNFDDELTPNDTVVYDMDNLVRNNGSEVPISLLDDSYGYAVVSAHNCLTGDDDADGINDSLIGNFRIIDDAGYEYRTSMVGNSSVSSGNIVFDEDETRAVVIPFNTVDGANWADIVAFVWDNDSDLSGNNNGDEDEDNVRNIPQGATFSVFQLDENEERLSCDTANFACGEGKTMNYGVNNDYPNSKGGPVLCDGGGLTEGQTNGYILLENPSVNDGDDTDTEGFDFVCFVGLNNGNGTGSMTNCEYRCSIDDPDCNPDP